MSDDFLRLLLCRHVFASVVLRVHRSFRSRPKNHPTTHPPLPDLDVVENPTLQRYTLDLALQGRGRRTVLRGTSVPTLSIAFVTTKCKIEDNDQRIAQQRPSNVQPA